MTLDELVQIQRAARNKANTRGEIYDAWQMDVAGIIAVVTALRDEMRDPSTFKSAKQECCAAEAQVEALRGEVKRLRELLRKAQIVCAVSPDDGDQKLEQLIAKALAGETT